MTTPARPVGGGRARPVGEGPERAASEGPGPAVGEGPGRAASEGRTASGAVGARGLTHVRPDGSAHMVDVSAKAVTSRAASAKGRVLLSPGAVRALRGGEVPKGDALAVARIAGLQAAKRTPDLIPLAHPIAVHAVTVDLTVMDDGVDIASTVRTADRTGIEMEALTCVSVAALALVDMIKAVDRHARITDIRVTAKSGGRSGDWTEADAATSHDLGSNDRASNVRASNDPGSDRRVAGSAPSERAEE